MNEERILELADYVEGLDHRIDIGEETRKHDITTPRDFHMDHCPQCLIGQTGVLFSSVASMMIKYWNSHEASEVLGLDDDVSKKLFFPALYSDLGEGPLLEITPEIAADVLRHFVDTGEITWPRHDTGIDYVLS